MYKDKIVELFINDLRVEKFILGLNDVSKKLAGLIMVDGFIDDFTELESFNGLPILKIEDIPENAIVVSCSVAIWPVTVSELLSEKKINYISIFDLMNDGRLDIQIPFFEGFKHEYESHKTFYRSLRNILVDKQSKVLLDDILNFRLNGDLEAMRKYKVNIETQYFEEFLNFEDDFIFLDVGGFDGATSIEFLKRCPNYGHIYVFEPSDENYNNVLENLSSYRNVTVIKKGLSNKTQSLRFSDGLGSKSGVTKEGNVEIQVDLLDNLITGAANFIKMDIEGSEIEAISGAHQTILGHHPILAISVYHKPTDMRTVFEEVMKLRQDYEVYLRHYTEGTDETVMFFVPVD